MPNNGIVWILLVILLILAVLWLLGIRIDINVH